MQDGRRELQTRLQRYWGSRRPLVLGAALAALLIAALAMVPHLRRWPVYARPVNLVLITVDTLRADHLGCYGYSRDSSPRIDELARSGTLFEQARVQWPKTNASIASMLTSTYSSTNRVRGAAAILDRRLVTVAEMLGDEGYYCASMVANAHLGKAFRFDQGFAEVHELWANRWVVHNTTINSAPYPNREIARQVSSWIRKNKERRFFLWVHFLDPHGPYRPPPGLEEQFTGDEIYQHQQSALAERLIPWWIKESNVRTLAGYVARYDAEIASTDAAVGVVLDELRQQGLTDKSLVVLTADHGESLGEHGYYFQHGRFLYESSLHVPLIFSLPGSVPRGRRIKEPVGLIDLVPTILELLGVEGESYREQIEGRSLAALFSDDAGFQSAPVFSEASGKQLSVVDGSWKLISSPKEGEKYKLFDLVVDPMEERNLADRHPQVVSRLKREMNQWRERSRPLGYASKPVVVDKLDLGVRRQLESLGYLGAGDTEGKAGGRSR